RGSFGGWHCLDRRRTGRRPWLRPGGLAARRPPRRPCPWFERPPSTFRTPCGSWKRFTANAQVPSPLGPPGKLPGVQSVMPAVEEETRLGRSLPRNFLWALVSNVLSSGTNWLTFVVLAKVCSAELVGQYALGLAVVTPLGFLTDLHLR